MASCKEGVCADGEDLCCEDCPNPCGCYCEFADGDEDCGKKVY